MDDYISKPIYMEDLVRSLKRCLPRDTGSPADELEIKPAENPAQLVQALPAQIYSTPVDMDEFMRLRESLGERADSVMPSLLTNFFHHTETLIEGAQQSLDNRQIEELFRAAHTLKSNSVYFGARTLTSIARQLESAARQGNLNEAKTLLFQAKQEYQRVKAALLQTQTSQAE